MEEVLLQISELRKEQGELRKIVDALRDEVAALRHANAGATRSLDLRKTIHASMGQAEAGVVVIEFSDFECPYCRQYQQKTLPGLIKKYVDSGSIQYVFMNFPLEFYAHAQSAAVAGVCAHQQDNFWRMHDLLFGNQAALNEATPMRLASELELDIPAFTACLHDPKMAVLIHDQVDLAEALGVQGTPAFLVGRVNNGVFTDLRKMSGAQRLANFERVLDALIAGR